MSALKDERGQVSVVEKGTKKISQMSTLKGEIEQVSMVCRETDRQTDRERARARARARERERERACKRERGRERSRKGHLSGTSGESMSRTGFRKKNHSFHDIPENGLYILMFLVRFCLFCFLNIWMFVVRAGMKRGIKLA